MKQVVRSLSTWMQTLISTSVGNPTRRKGSARLSTNACECLELRALPAALIGVDFGPADGSPKNWKNFGSSTNGTVTKLTDESGVASKVSLDIKYADGQGGEVSPTFAAAQLPKHSQSLAGLSGAIRDNSKITLTFKNLTASGLYEVYVFGGTTKADSQSITLAGSGQSQTFSQILGPGKLFVNGLAGSSATDLSAYAKTVKATSSGQITISAQGIEFPNCSLAGVAIRPLLPDIQLNSVKSNGESTLTVKYTIKNAAVKPFRIAAYASEDTLFSAAKDTLLSSVQISDAADLTPGLHTKVYQIGQEIKLDRFTPPDETIENYLLFVADDQNLAVEDDANRFNEDNKAAFSGAYVYKEKNLVVVGSSGDDKITLVTDGETLNVSLPGVNLSYSSSKILLVTIQAAGGNDQVLAAKSRTRIVAYGGAGNDRLIAGKRDDYLVGGDGNDQLDGEDGRDELVGDAGDDSLFGDIDIDFLFGGDGNDALYGGEGSDVMTGGSGSDLYVFGIASAPELDIVNESLEQQEPLKGVDTLDFSKVGASTALKVDLRSRSESKTIATHKNRTVAVEYDQSRNAWENVIGSPGDDVISGNVSANRLEGLGGNDFIKGWAGIDDLRGGPGNDEIYGAGGIVDGGDGDDVLYGLLGTDILIGGAGADRLKAKSDSERANILISGAAKAFDTEAGRLAVMQIWFSKEGLSRKIELLRGGVGTPKVTLKAGVNVQSDGSKDEIVVAPGAKDWIFYRALEDTLSNKEAGDILELL